MSSKLYKFEGKLWRDPDTTGAYIIFPGDIKKIFGKGLVYAHFKVDDLEFDGCIMNKGYKHYKNRPTYTISINRERRLTLRKIWGDMVTVVVREREKEK